ncbi:MAG: hypothetical protein KKE17_07645 [Proteobacteria bacterium]|nr:hypothetical protein [Pseudomonadota bacterium]
MDNIRHQTLFLLAVIALIFLSYINTFHSPLILDDRASFVEIADIYIDDLSLDSLKQLSNTQFGKKRLIPIITFAFDHYISDSNIVQFHLTNILIHILATIALFLFLLSLRKTDSGIKALFFTHPGPLFALAVCALWGLNPVQTNAVTYLVQRMTSLAALFYLTSLTFYIHARLSDTLIKRIMFFTGCLVSAVLAFLSKEISATLPPMILLVESLFLSPGLAGKIIKAIKARHLLLVVFTLIIILPLIQRPWNDMVLAGYYQRDFTMLERVFTEFRIVVFYLTLLILPLPGRLNFDHDFSISSSLLNPISTFSSLTFLLLLLFLAFKIRKKHPLITFGILWFYLNLIIESTVVPLELIFEHRLYLPSMGFFIAFIGLVDLFFSRLKTTSEKKQKVFALLIIILASFSSMLTTTRNYDWRDSLSIYDDARKKSPNKPRVYTNASKAMALQGKFDEALAMQTKALELSSHNREEYITSANNILAVYNSRKEYDQAVAFGENFLKNIKPNINFRSFHNLMYNLAYSYHKTKQYKKAFSSCLTGLTYQPDSFYFVAAELEQILTAVNNDEDLRQDFQLEGEKIDIPVRMTIILLTVRQYSEAAHLIERTKKKFPDNEKIIALEEIIETLVENNKKAVTLSNIKNDETYASNIPFRLCMDLADFILNNYPPLISIIDSLLNKAESIDPENPFIPLYRIRKHSRLKQHDLALLETEKALKRFSEFPPLLNVAFNLYNTQGNRSKAAITLQQLLKVYPGNSAWRLYDLYW